MIPLQDERERIIVRRFKFEELRIEQIQDLEVSVLFLIFFITFVLFRLVFKSVFSVFQSVCCILVLIIYGIKGSYHDRGHYTTNYNFFQLLGLS